MPVPWVRKAYARRTEKLPVRVHIRQRNAHKVTAVMDLKRWLITLTASLSGVLAVLLLCRESVAAQGVRDGIDLCITSVIPALFPFFAAAQLLYPFEYIGKRIHIEPHFICIPGFPQGINTYFI